MAYFIKRKSRGEGDQQQLKYLPLEARLRDGTQIVLDYLKREDEEQTFQILKPIVEEGLSYPQEEMDSLEDFRAYYLSHDAFVARRADSSGEVLGAFYIKPNFPGRCSHISNSGFIVKPQARGKGLGRFMAENYLYMARDLGYRASLFNLVFVSNVASLKLWRSMGFKETGRIPKAGNLKGLGLVDAIQFYYDYATLAETNPHIS